MFITKYIDIYGYISKIEIENFSSSVYGDSIKGLKISNENEELFIFEIDENICQNDIIIINFCEGENSRDYLNFPKEIFYYYFNDKIKDCELTIEYEQNFYSIENVVEEVELKIQEVINNPYTSDRFYFYPIKVKNNTGTFINIGNCKINYRKNMGSPYDNYSFNIDDSIYPGEEKYFIINKIKDRVDENLIHSNTKFLEKLDELYSLDEVTLELNEKERVFSF